MLVGSVLAKMIWIIAPHWLLPALAAVLLVGALILYLVKRKQD